MKYDLSKKINRFAKRTLAAFSETLFSLLERKSFEEITVNELCEVCNYPRATFYNYFDDIYDLLDYCWSNMASQIHIEDYHDIKPEKRTEVLFEKLYTYLDGEKSKIDKIMKHNEIDGVLSESLRRFMGIKIKMIIQNCPHYGGYPIPFEMIVVHYSNTLQLILEYCFFQEERISKKEAERCIVHLLGSLERNGEEP